MLKNSKQCLHLVLMAASLAPPMTFTGCTARVGVSYRVYDPSYRDYHLWDDHETVYYNRWAEDTHREHREYRQLNDREQAEYWDWRHQHSDKD